MTRPNTQTEEPVVPDETLAEEKKPRRSAIDKLSEQLAKDEAKLKARADKLEAARVAAQARLDKRITVVQDKLDKVAEKLVAIHEERDALLEELNEIKAAAPFVTDGVGETDSERERNEDNLITADAQE